MSYENSDLYFAALLHALGFKMLGLRRDGRRAYFQFEPNEEIEGLLIDWMNDEGSVVPSVYAESIRKLKSMAMGGQ